MSTKTRRKRRAPALDWRDLAARARQGRDQTEIALANLIIARGLPGAEHLNIPAYLAALDSMAKRAAREIDRNKHNFRRDSAKHGDTWAQWRVGMIVTVLQQDLDALSDSLKTRVLDSNAEQPKLSAAEYTRR